MLSKNVSTSLIHADSAGNLAFVASTIFTIFSSLDRMSKIAAASESFVNLAQFGYFAIKSVYIDFIKQSFQLRVFTVHTSFFCRGIALRVSQFSSLSSVLVNISNTVAIQDSKTFFLFTLGQSAKHRNDSLNSSFMQLVFNEFLSCLILQFRFALQIFRQYGGFIQPV